MLPPDTRSQKFCECTACGQLFTSVRAFDRHQTGMDPVRCHTPTVKGLAIIRHSTDGRPVWGRDAAKPAPQYDTESPLAVPARVGQGSAA